MNKQKKYKILIKILKDRIKEITPLARTYEFYGDRNYIKYYEERANLQELIKEMQEESGVKRAINRNSNRGGTADEQSDMRRDGV